MGKIQDKEMLAELCGAIIGDGWIQSNERGFFVAGNPKEDKDYYDLHLCKLISDLITPTKPKNFPYWKVYGISLYDKTSIKKLLNLGLPKGKKVNSVKVPDWISNSNKKVIEAFVRGFFDTDGCVFCQKDYTQYAKEFDSTHHTKIRIRFSNISQKLIEQTFLLMKKVGFRCVKRTLRGGFSNNRNNRDIHIIEVNELRSINNFFNDLKPNNPKHTTKYKIWKKFGFCPPNTNLKQRRDVLKNKFDPYKLYKRG